MFIVDAMVGNFIGQVVFFLQHFCYCKFVRNSRRKKNILLDIDWVVFSLWLEGYSVGESAQAIR
jgi:hypothetical protein